MCIIICKMSRPYNQYLDQAVEYYKQPRNPLVSSPRHYLPKGNNIWILTHRGFLIVCLFLFLKVYCIRFFSFGFSPLCYTFSVTPMISWSNNLFILTMYVAFHCMSTIQCLVRFSVEAIINSIVVTWWNVSFYWPCT